MARSMIVQLIDDLNGEEADETVGFGLDGVQYEIELTKENAEQLRTDLQMYIAAGRRGTGTVVSKPKSKRTPAEVHQIREWAKARGIIVAPQGRISEDVIQQYQAASNKGRSR